MQYEGQDGVSHGPKTLAKCTMRPDPSWAATDMQKKKCRRHAKLKTATGRANSGKRALVGLTMTPEK